MMVASLFLYPYCRGFGFVTFEDPAAVEAVLQASPHELDHKKVCKENFAIIFFARAIEMDSLKTNFHAPSANVWRLRILMCSGHLALWINSYNRLFYHTLAIMF